MILEVDGVDTFYGETQALFGASLAIERAKVFALLGPNGAEDHHAPFNSRADPSAPRRRSFRRA